MFPISGTTKNLQDVVHHSALVCIPSGRRTNPNLHADDLRQHHGVESNKHQQLLLLKYAKGGIKSMLDDKCTLG